MMDNLMNDNNIILNGLDQNEKHSYSTRQQNAGDGPEVIQNSLTLNENNSEKSVNHNNLIESVNNNHTEKIGNENKDLLVDDLMIENDQNLVNYTKGLKSISQNDQMKSKEGICSNRTFSLTSCDNFNIIETIKNIIQLIDKLNSSNELIKHDLTAELDKLGSLIVSYEQNNTQKINSKININSKLYDIQEIQKNLEYFMEQLSKTHMLYEDIQSKLNKNIDFSLKNDDKRINIFKYNKVDKFNKNSEEDDILSVEELSWDDYNMILANTAEKHKNDKNNAENNSSLINFNKLIRSNEEKTNNQENKEDNFSVEESLKTQNSSSFTLPTNNHIDLPSTERSNSFQEIKNRFENLKKVEPKVSVRSSVVSTKPNSTKTERKHHSIIKKCVSPHTNSTKMNSKNIKMSLNNESIIDDLVDNSAFLVSSIDSYTESVSLPIPMKRLNSHSTLYGNNTNHTLITQFKPNSEQDEKTNSGATNINYKPSNLINCHNATGVSSNSLVTIDLLAEQSNLCNRSSFVNMPNKKNCNQELTNIIKNRNIEEHCQFKNDQYIEIVNNGIREDNQVYIESPYIIPKESENNLNSSNISSDHIIAMGKQTKRHLQPRVSDSETSKISYSTSNYHYIKELVESERLYVNQLFIVSQILYNRIKAANIISLRNFNIIFPPILHKMYKFHLSFFKDLDLIFQQYINLELLQNNNKVKYDKIQNTAIKTSRLGQTFLCHIERDNWSFFSMYRQYYSRLPVALNIYNKLKRNSHKFDRLTKSLQHNEHCHGLDLIEFILLPIQRLSKYLMILRKLLSNLTSKETEEKVSILAVEHLLYSFLTEYEETDAAISLKRVQCKHHISSHNEYNGKHSSIDKINNQNNVTVSNNCNKSFTEQLNMLPNLAKCENIRNVLSQSTLMPDQNGITNEFMDTNIKFYSPKLDQISSIRDSQKTSESIPQIDSGTTGSLESIHYYHQTHHKTFKNNKSAYNLENETNRNENYPVKYHQFSDTRNSINRPISVPPFHTDQSAKPKKSPKDLKLHLPTEKLKYHTTDECSVCLNSQDEFEIDTSLEDECGADEDDEDDKTCRAAPCHTNKKPINTKMNMSDSIIRRHETNSSGSLNISPNKMSGIIEFCSSLNVSKEHILLTTSQQPLQMKLTDSTSYVLFSDVIPKLTESIIDKKVINIVTILSHVVLETMDHDINDRKLSNGRLFNYGFENVEKHPNHSSEESLKKSIELSNDFDDKNNSKKFSLRHLFSLKKRNKFDNSSNEYSNMKSSNSPSVSLRKRMSINESSMRKNQNH